MKYVAFLLGVLFGFGCEAANITASVNRNIVPVDEVFVLTISADENTNEKPDLSVLDADYDIYSTSSSKSTYIVNGKASATTKWQIGISANKAGKQKIPAIKVGNDVSNEIEIEILPEGTVVDEQPEEQKYKIKTEFDAKKSYYVQEQIPVNVVVTDIGGLQGGEPVFDNSDEWIIKSLGQPDVVSRYENGINVRDIIFKYVLFAQKSGKLFIPAVRFNGYTVSNSGGGIFSGNILNLNVGFPSGFGFEVPVKLVSPKKQIDIKPVPADYGKNWWLPAKDVTISADFVDNSEFMEGEAFSREIVLKAVGVIDTQLPEFDFQDTESLKQYPQKSTNSTELVAGEPVATKKTVNVYIPEKSGKVVLPAIEVEWFNVKTLKPEIAKVPEVTIFVKKNPNIKTTIETELKLQTTENTANENVKNDNKILTLAQLTSLLIAVLLLGMLLGYQVFKCRKFKGEKPHCETRAYPDFIVKKAYENDFRGLRDALISWATGFYPQKNITTLKDVANAVEDESFSEQVDIIVDKLYNPKDEKSFNAKTFADLYNKILKKTKKKDKKNSPLPKLYQ